LADSVALRMTRDLLAAVTTPSARMTFNSPGPNTAMMLSTKNKGGNAIHASTTRWTKTSTVPPKYPLRTPKVVANRMLNATAPKPTVTEMRAPYTMRLKRSRPRLSVPR
jgi:hypothetical protein